MAEILIPLLCAVFGAVCARYVTALGLLLSAIATFLVLLALNALAGGVYSVGSLAAAFVAIQVGYFLGVVGTVLAHRFAPTRIRRVTGRDGFKREHD